MRDVTEFFHVQITIFEENTLYNSTVNSKGIRGPAHPYQHQRPNHASAPHGKIQYTYRTGKGEKE